MDLFWGSVFGGISGGVMALALRRLNADFDAGRRSGEWVWLFATVAYVFSWFPNHRRPLTYLFVAWAALGGFVVGSGMLD